MSAALSSTEHSFALARVPREPANRGRDRWQDVVVPLFTDQQVAVPNGCGVRGRTKQYVAATVLVDTGRLGRLNNELDFLLNSIRRYASLTGGAGVALVPTVRLGLGAALRYWR